MGEPVPISLGTRSNPGRHGHDGAARLINAYAEKAGEEGKIPYPIYAIDGQTSFATLTGGAGVRAALVLEAEGRAKVVAGRVLYNVDSGGAVTTIGGIPSDGLVFMARNRKTPDPQVGIVCDGLYFIETNNTLQQVTDPDLPPPVSISFLNGYFVLPTSSGRYYVTGIDEGTTIDALDFANAEANPDGLLRSAVRSTTLVLLGPLSTEFHEPVDGDFPFQRQSVIGTGCYAAGGVCELTAIIQGRSIDTVIWPGTNNKGDYAGVFMLDGYSAMKISEPWVDRLVQREPDKASILATSWASEGNVFYNLAGSTFTATYDTTTGFWHERQSYGLTRWRYSVAMNIAGKLILGNYAAGTLVESRHDLYDENGQPIIWTIQTPPVHGYPYRTRVNAVHIDMIPGVGLGGGIDPFTKLLLHCDGADASTTFTDSSNGAHVFTASGDAQIDTAQSKFGGASALFDGTGDWITTPDHADFALGSGDWTIDFWFNCNAAGGTALSLAGQRDAAGSNASTSFRIRRTNTNIISFLVSDGSANASVTGTTQFTNAVNPGWHHAAFVRTGNTLKAFIDGVQEGGDVSFSATVVDSSNTLGVGSEGDFITNPWNGWIDEFRLSVGIARWTANFTPPTVQYSLETPDHLANPKVMFDYSRDGGKNWSAQRMLPVGAQGQHLTRVVTRRLGLMPRGGFTPRISMSAAVVRGCVGLGVDFDKLTA